MLVPSVRTVDAAGYPPVTEALAPEAAEVALARRSHCRRRLSRRRRSRRPCHRHGLRRRACVHTGTARSPLVWALVLLTLVIVAGVAWLAVVQLTHTKPAAKPVAAPVVDPGADPRGRNPPADRGRAHAAGLSGSYLTASERSSLLDPAHYGAPAGTPDLEGFLFPATYELYRGRARRAGSCPSSCRRSPKASATRRRAARARCT